MSLDQLVLGDSSLSLQCVDVLCVVAQQKALLLQQADEHVALGGLKLAWVQLACKLKGDEMTKPIVSKNRRVLSHFIEGFRIFLEVFDGEDGLWRGQIVLLQVMVDP